MGGHGASFVGCISFIVALKFSVDAGSTIVRFPACFSLILDDGDHRALRKVRMPARKKSRNNNNPDLEVESPQKRLSKMTNGRTSAFDYGDPRQVQSCTRLLL